MEKFFGKRALIIGSGESGKGAAKALKQCGVIIDFYEGNIPDNVDLMIISPGVPEARFKEIADKRNIPLMGELELGFILDDAPVVAVTGTNGKTTTTMLTGEILKASGFDPIVCGNIGISYAKSAILPHDRSVVEASSFQLLTVNSFKPRVAIITNITPDHLDRHKSMSSYIDAKLNICLKQDENDYIIVPPELKNILYERKVRSNIIVLGEDIFVKDGWFTVLGKRIANVSEALYKEDLFITDALFAMTAALLVGADENAAQKAVSEFKKANHRLSFSGRFNGKNYYNDSKGTNIGAALAACRCMDGETALIAGGSYKGYEFDELFSALPDNIRYVIGIGEVREKLKEAALRSDYRGFIEASDLQDAVHLAASLDVINVLLSPAAASFDHYSGYDKRGEHFERLIRA